MIVSEDTIKITAGEQRLTKLEHGSAGRCAIAVLDGNGRRPQTGHQSVRKNIANSHNRPGRSNLLK